MPSSLFICNVGHEKKVKNCQIDDLCVKHNWYNSGNDDLKKKSSNKCLVSHKSWCECSCSAVCKNHKKNVACNEKSSTFNHFDCKAKMVKGSVHTKHKIINQFLVGFESSEKFWFYVF